MRRLLLFYIALSVKASDEARLMRFPAISNDKVVFSYGGDLYLVSANGGDARKITSHKGYEMFPKFSPDGSKIAFTGQFDGNTEVYVIPSSGGVPKRLTYTATLDRDDIGDRMGPNNIVMTWTPDGKNIVYRSRKQSFNDFKGMLFTVSADGGLSSELPLSTGGFCSFSPDGKQLVFNRVFREFRTWKYYKGGMADDIRIFDFEKKTTEKITDNINQDIEPMWVGRDIFFLSDRDRIMNLYVYNIDNKQTTKVTNFDKYDIKFPSVGGGFIVFENAGFIYKFDTKTRKYERLAISITDDAQWARDEFKDAGKTIRSADLSPNGERVVFGARGEVFSVPSDKGITRNMTNSSGVHERDVRWSPNGQYVAYLSDVTGEFEIYIQKQDGSEPPVQLTFNSDTYKFKIEWSPDSKMIVWSDRKLRLFYVDVTSKQVKLVHQSLRGRINNYSFSPDNRWILFEQLTNNDFSMLSVFNVESGILKDITNSWFNSSDAAFSRDGKYIVFVSSRDFSPIYSQTEWNHAYINMDRVYLMCLRKDIPSPFLGENTEVKIETTPEKKDSTDKKDKGIKVDIDFDNIDERIVSLPIKASNYYNLACINNYVYYNERTGSDGSVLKMYDLKKKEETELGRSMQYTISANGKKMLIKESDKWGVVDLATSKITLKDVIDVSNMKVWVEYQKEWKQIYDEAWRQMRDFFYVENMHGVDWKAIHEKYAPLVPYVRHRDDLTYIIGEMIAELSIGHAYINGGERPRVERIPMGLLGAKITKDASGYFKIEKILKGANWNKDLRSPLTEVGVDVKEGNYILAIDGKSVKEESDIYKLLQNKANVDVQLEVNTVSQTKGSRKVIIKPLKDESDLYYYNWVQDNLKKVSDATDNQVGYIHVPDMDRTGLNEFVKYFYPQLDKKVLIIDDRGNGGGNVSPMILERLSRELYRSKMMRNAQIPLSVPSEMMIGPKIMLIDQYSASDGDLFPYGFKKLKLGKVLGKRSWGGVVGITGTLPFIDGTDLRKPEYASYSSDSSAWIIEGYGVDPDIEIDNDPYREYIGTDDQLNKAIDMAKEELKNYKPLPAIPVGPDKSR